MHKNLVIIAGVLTGITISVAGIMYMNVAGSTQASSVQALASFIPNKVQTKPGEEFDMLMNISTRI